MNRNDGAKAKYLKMQQVVSAVIRDWDPYGLLAGGSPRDEFDHEIALIVAQVPRIHSAIDAANAVSGVFCSSFEPGVLSVGACAEVGAKLFSALLAERLIE